MIPNIIFGMLYYIFSSYAMNKLRYYVAINPFAEQKTSQLRQYHDYINKGHTNSQNTWHSSMSL